MALAPPPPGLPPPPPRVPGTPVASTAPAGNALPAPPPGLPPPPPRVAGAPPPAPPPPTPKSAPPPPAPPPPTPKSAPPPPAPPPPAPKSAPPPPAPPPPAPKAVTPPAASPASTSPAPVTPTAQSAAALPIKSDAPTSTSSVSRPVQASTAAPPPTGTFERPQLRSVPRSTAAASTTPAPTQPTAAPAAAPGTTQGSAVSSPSANLSQAPTESAKAAAVPPRPATVPSKGGDSAPVVSTTAGRPTPTARSSALDALRDESWGAHTELTADERTAWYWITTTEYAARRRCIERALELHHRMVSEVVTSEDNHRSRIAQDEDSQRTSQIVVPFFVTCEVLRAATVLQGRPAAGAATVQDEIKKFREEIALDRAQQNRLELEQHAALKTQQGSLVNHVERLQVHVNTALERYERGGASQIHAAATEAAAHAADAAAARVSELVERASSRDATVSDEARRLAKRELQKLQYDACDANFRTLLRDERGARDFIEELQLCVRREVVDLCCAAYVLSPSRRRGSVHHHHQPASSMSPSPMRPEAAGPSDELGGQSAAASFQDSLRRESIDLHRGRRFVAYFHLIGYDHETAAVYSRLFLEHGFGFAVDMSLPEAEGLAALHDVCRNVTEGELDQMGIRTIGEKRTMFARMKAFERGGNNTNNAGGTADWSLVRDEEPQGQGRVLTALDDFRLGSPSMVQRHLPQPWREDSPGSMVPLPATDRHPSQEEESRHQNDAFTRSDRSREHHPPTDAPYLTAAMVRAFRDKCLARLKYLDAQLSAAWMECRHAARRRASFTYSDDAEWEAAFRAASASDALRTSDWLAALENMEQACASGGGGPRHTCTVHDLPTPLGSQRVSARGNLLERRAAGLPCVKSSRQPSIGISSQRASQPQRPSWW